jgi:hypothetical protein
MSRASQVSRIARPIRIAGGIEAVGHRPALRRDRRRGVHAAVGRILPAHDQPELLQPRDLAGRHDAGLTAGAAPAWIERALPLHRVRI